MMTEEAVQSNLPIPPGEYLEEVIGELGMTKNELARRMDRPASKLSPIFKGDKAITPDTAIRLEKVVGVPAHIWTGMEAEYRLTLARLEENEREEQLKSETIYITKFCYNELVKAGEAAQHSKPTDKVRELQNFFGVMSLTSVLRLHRYRAAFRCGKSGVRSPEALASWLRMGEKRAQKIFCATFNRDRLLATLDKLRTMTLRPPENFLKELRAELANCGVALVICPSFPKTGANGATFWIGRDKAVLMITIRGKWADIFWFSLFHEIGHILLHKQQEVILEDDSENKHESRANKFSSDVLIPRDAYKRFVKQGRFYLIDIKTFADKIGVHSGIVVGRLQHEGLLRREWGNNIRERYKWVKTL